MGLVRLGVIFLGALLGASVAHAIVCDAADSNRLDDVGNKGAVLLNRETYRRVIEALPPEKLKSILGLENVVREVKP